MSELVLIPHLGDAELRKKATGAGWWAFKGKGEPFDGFVLLRCGCNVTRSMDAHTITGDGTVTPSILCGNCGWHVHGRLEGWTHGFREASKR